MKFIHEQIREKSIPHKIKSSVSGTTTLLVIAGASIFALAGVLLATESGANRAKNYGQN